MRQYAACHNMACASNNTYATTHKWAHTNLLPWFYLFVPPYCEQYLRLLGYTWKLHYSMWHLGEALCWTEPQVNSASQEPWFALPPQHGQPMSCSHFPVSIWLLLECRVNEDKAVICFTSLMPDREASARHSSRISLASDWKTSTPWMFVEHTCSHPT